MPYALESTLGRAIYMLICGEEHRGSSTDWAYKLPDAVWALSEDERAAEARFNSDLCQFGQRYFIRCVLDVPFTGSSESFGWGVWAEVDWSTFDRYMTIYDQDGSSEPVHSGSLANDIPAYPGSLSTPVSISFRDATKRPSIFLHEEDGSRLAREQRAGMSEARYHEALHTIAHR
jgi:hypothetical protein